MLRLAPKNNSLLKLPAQPIVYSSIDPLHLEIKLKNGTEDEKADAYKIMPILEKKHLLLVASNFVIRNWYYIRFHDY